MKGEPAKPLRGARVAITRPVGMGAAMSRRVRGLGGTPFSLPGSSLRAGGNPQAARAALRDALHSELAIFTSPAAVRFAGKLMRLRTRARIIAPGAGTAAALKHAGVLEVAIPKRSDSEGILALPELQRVRGKRIGIIGAPGGRDLLPRELAARGARITSAYAYRRVPARLDRRHFDALTRGRSPLYVQLSSAEGLRHLLENLSVPTRRKLLTGSAVASSARLHAAAEAAGFARVLRAESAHDADLIAAIVAAHARR